VFDCDIAYFSQRLMYRVRRKLNTNILLYALVQTGVASEANLERTNYIISSRPSATGRLQTILLHISNQCGLLN